MRDQNRGRAALAGEVKERFAQLRRRHFVEMAEGLVGEQDLRLHRKRARDRHALAHAAGQFVRIGIGELTETEPVQPGQAALALFVLRQADKLEWKPRIVERRAPGQQPVLLEDSRDAPAEGVKIGVRAFVADVNGAFGGGLQPDHQVEKRRLAAARLPDDRNDFARRNGEIEPVNRDDRLAGGRLPEHLAQPGHADRRRPVHGCCHARHRSRRVSIRATMPSSRNSSATSTMVQAKTSATEKSSCATDN